jgi:hypothetical protein
MMVVQVLGQIKDPRAVEPLVAAQHQGDLEVITGAYQFFIERGEKGSEAALIMALEKYGSRQMAEHFLNCGNDLLEEAARKWAEAHGYTITSSLYGVDIPIWGSNP